MSYIRWNKLLWYVKQLWPCLYYTQYWDKDGSHFTIWRMWLSRCFRIEDVLIIPHVLVEQNIRRICLEEIDRYVNSKLSLSNIIQTNADHKIEYERNIEDRLTNVFRKLMCGIDGVSPELPALPEGDPEEGLAKFFEETMGDVLADAPPASIYTPISLLSAASSEEIFREHVRHLLSQGIFPTPTKLNDAMHSNVMRPNNLNGRQSRWRAEELIEAGYTKINGKWSKDN